MTVQRLMHSLPRPISTRHVLLLLVPLLLVGASLWQAVQLSPPLVTPLSAGVALVVLIAGLLPLFLRPTYETFLSAMFVVLLAAMLIIPFDLSPIRPQSIPAQPFLFALPPYATSRLFVGVLAVLMGFHYASRFPVRPARLARIAPSSRALAGIYAATLALCGVMVLLPEGGLRIGVSILVAGGAIWLILAALGQFVLVARLIEPAYVDSAARARLLLLGVLLAELPMLLRIPAAVLNLPVIPYNVALIFQILLPLFMAYGINRYDLFSIDAAVRRTLAYATVWAIFLVVFFGLILGLTSTLTNAVPDFPGAVTLAALILAAVAFRPVYDRIQHWVDRAIYPERRIFVREMAAARAALGRVASRQEILALLTEAFPQAIDAAGARFFPAPEAPTGPTINPEDGPQNSQTGWTTALSVGTQILGHYWLGPRRSGIPYSGEESAGLQLLAAQSALALAYADTLHTLNELNRDLESEVQERAAQVMEQQRALVMVEERHRLAQDLHDSVIQTLFSISLGSRALRKLVARNPDAAVAELGAQEAAAQQALAEMRALLAEMRRPLIEDGDLAGALRHQSAQLHQQTGLHVALDLPPRCVLPEAVADELLFVAREALHNVVKHGAVDRAVCILRRADGCIHLTVQDQGRGFHPSAQGTDVNGHGLGLGSMRERVHRLNGTLHIDSTPGMGTTVQVQVPDKRG